METDERMSDEEFERMYGTFKKYEDACNRLMWRSLGDGVKGLGHGFADLGGYFGENIRGFVQGLKMLARAIFSRRKP